MPYAGRGGRYYRPEPRSGRGARFASTLATMRPEAEPQATAQDKQNDEDADFWRFMSDVAPVAGGVLGAVGGGIAGGIGGSAVPGVGTALGALAGAGSGATLGANLGGMAGQAMESGANQMTAGREDELKRHDAEEQDKQDRKAAIFAALAGMRR